MQERLVYSVPEVMDLLGLSRQTVYHEINSGRLSSFTLGRRRLVSGTALRDWVERREADAEIARESAA